MMLDIGRERSHSTETINTDTKPEQGINKNSTLFAWSTFINHKRQENCLAGNNVDMNLFNPKSFTTN